MELVLNFHEVTDNNLPELHEMVLLKLSENSKEYYGDGIFCGHRTAPVKNQIIKDGELLELEFDEEEWLWQVSPIDNFNNYKWEFEPELVSHFAKI